MSFWTRLFGSTAGITPNAGPGGTPPSVGVPGYSPGDPNGLEYIRPPVQVRSLPVLQPSPWDGWPAEWSTPGWDWGPRFNALVDIAWTCIDRSAMVLSAMPVYRTRGGEIVEPESWMINPDPSIYTSWHEFAKQLFRDFLMGEVFVLPIATGSDGYPFMFRVIPPWMITVEMTGGRRSYRLGTADVTSEILHIRYDSATDTPRGRGPLDVAGGRQITAGLIEKYTREVVSNGGVPLYTLETADALDPDDAQDLLNQWITSRRTNFGAPPVLDNGVTLKTHLAMSPKDMAMLEIAQFTEARIATLLGVPPFIVGLPNGGDSLTYANVSQLFEQHDRMSLQPLAAHVMGAISGWALPSTQAVELNRDQYSRPDFGARAEAYAKLVPIGVMTVDEVRAAERLQGEATDNPTQAITAITGGANQ